MYSPVAVLKAVARALGCEYQDIEVVVVNAMGGAAMQRVNEPDIRLRAIRLRMGTPEGECVIQQAHMIAREMAA